MWWLCASVRHGNLYNCFIFDQNRQAATKAKHEWCYRPLAGFHWIFSFFVLPVPFFCSKSGHSFVEYGCRRVYEMILWLETKATLFNGRCKHLEIKTWNWMVHFQQHLLSICAAHVNTKHKLMIAKLMKIFDRYEFFVDGISSTQMRYRDFESTHVHCLVGSDYCNPWCARYFFFTQTPDEGFGNYYGFGKV